MKRLLLLLLLLAVPASGAIVTPEVVILDPTADIQEAIDGTADGGVLSLGAGVFVADDSTGWFITGKAITIEGQPGTILRPYLGDTDAPDGDYNAFTIDSTSHVTFRNLTIGNSVAASAASDSVYGNGIYINNNAARDSTCCVTLENVTIEHMGGFAIMLDGPKAVSDLSVRFCSVLDNTGGSFWNAPTLDAVRSVAYYYGGSWWTITGTVVP